MTELFGPFAEYNSNTIDDNKLNLVQNCYINSVVENHLPFDEDDVFASSISRQRHSVGRIRRHSGVAKPTVTFPRSKSTEVSGSY